MSTNDQITRIRSAKAALKAAIAEKGVNVPGSALIDGYSEYVKDIEQIDLSADTVTPADVRTGVTFHAADGEQYVGTAELSILPPRFVPLDYIESTGTQYINTGFKHNQNTRVVCEFEYSGGYYIFGACNAWKNKNMSLYMAGAAYNTTSINFTALSKDGKKHTVDWNKNVLTIDGTVKNTFSASTFSCDYPMFLFADDTGGTAKEFITARMYSCQIYDNGTLIRDFLPCKSADGVAGMYDVVNGVFYENSGTGVFYKPGEIAAPAGKQVYTGTITGNNLSLINVGVTLSDKDTFILIPSNATNDNQYGTGCCVGLVTPSINKMILMVAGGSLVYPNNFTFNGTIVDASAVPDNSAITYTWYLIKA